MTETQVRWYPGAEYHVILTTAGAAPFFYDREDRTMYLEMIGKARAEHRFDVYAYCLMTDHVHLQIKTHQLHIKQVINKIDYHYRHFFNRKYQLIDSTYHTETFIKPINSRNDQLETNKYIHLSPFEASIVSSPKDFEWSSYRTYLNFQKTPHVNSSPILSHFSYPQNVHYQRFIEKEPAHL